MDTNILNQTIEEIISRRTELYTISCYHLLATTSVQWHVVLAKLDELAHVGDVLLLR
jgi:hypothetical protein